MSTPVVRDSRDDLPWSIEDEFAKAAMQGMIAASGNSLGDYDYNSADVANSAYEASAEMMKARRK